MLELNLSFTITAIVALVSLLSPILTALINNHHQTKIKKLELSQSTVRADALHKTTIFENYLSSITQLAISESAEDMIEYGKTYGLALLYAPSDIQGKMSQINALIQNEDFAEAIPLIETLIPLIQSTLCKPQNQPLQKRCTKNKA